MNIESHSKSQVKLLSGIEVGDVVYTIYYGQLRFGCVTQIVETTEWKENVEIAFLNSGGDTGWVFGSNVNKLDEMSYRVIKEGLANQLQELEVAYRFLD